MKYIKKLKTSDRISLIFSLFNFISLIILLISINIIYFFIWYSDQKKESLYDMNINYNSYTNGINQDNKEAFKKYILQKDTLIIPEDGSKPVCSDGVSKKIHIDLEKVKDKYFYSGENKIYFIFSNYYEGIGEVKVLFDTTPYIKSQIIIIKISFIIMFLWGFMYFFIGKRISKYALKDLEKISKEAKDLDINNFHKIEVCGGENDEIKILANAINKSFSKIQSQTENLKQFITDVSHEFKTPLMIINSKIDFFNKKQEKQKLESGDLENLLKGIKNNTKKLNKLLETLFFLSRITEGIQDFKKENINLSSYLPKFVTNFSESFEGKNINIIYKIEKNISQEIELSTFNIIIENLLTNAIKFNKNNDLKLEIGLNKKCFYVKDNGIGISKDLKNKIWEKFYRNDLNIEGFGVGLFIIKRIIDIYNWKIELESELGEGSKFIINF